MAKEEIARFYTRSRRFPKMIGRMTDGSRIPGGPYTLTQVGFGGVALMGLLMTRTMWSTGATLLDLAITVGVAWGVTWLVGLIPMTRRNLVLAFVGAVAAMFKPHGGRYQDRSIRLARPHRAIGATKMPTPVREPQAPIDTPTALEQPTAKPTRPTQPQPVTTAVAAKPSTHTALTGVERLLQQAKKND